MTRVGVGGVLRPAEHVVHDPVQPPAKVVLGPALEVMQEELLCPFLKPGFMDVGKMQSRISFRLKKMLVNRPPNLAFFRNQIILALK